MPAYRSNTGTGTARARASRQRTAPQTASATQRRSAGDAHPGQAPAPSKKPRGGKLTDEQRQCNCALGAVRIRVEHCLGWLKNWAALATRFRCAHDCYNPIMGVICGLVNAQTACWQAARAAQDAYSA